MTNMQKFLEKCVPAKPKINVFEGIELKLTLHPFKKAGKMIEVEGQKFDTSLVLPTARRALEGYMIKVPRDPKKFLSNLQ
jgi:hypothetical protein